MVTVSLGLLNVAVVIVTVLVVASITLGVTVSVTTDSLRRFGVRHASVIADDTLWKIAAYFATPTTTIDVLKNMSRSRPFVPIVSSPLDEARWADTTWMGVFNTPSCSIVRTQWLEGSMIDAEVNVQNTRLTYPYAYRIDWYQSQRSIYAEPYNFSSLLTRTEVHYSESLVLNHTWVYHNHSQDAETTLATLNQATFGGRQTLWSGLPILSYYGDIMILFTGIGCPLRDKSGTLAGYGIIPLPLYKLNDYLNEIRGTATSYGFVLDALGYVLSTSSPIPYENTTLIGRDDSVPTGCAAAAVVGQLNSDLGDQNVRQMLCRLSAAKYPYPPLQAVVADESLANAVALTTAYKVVQGQGYFAASASVPSRYPNNVLQLIITMPEIEVVGDLATPRNVAIGVSIGVMLGTSVAVGILVTFLMRSVRRVVEALDGESTHDGSEGRNWSWASEIQTVEAAYAAMQQELRRISAFVPTAVQAPHHNGITGDHHQGPDDSNAKKPDDAEGIASVAQASHSGGSNPLVAPVTLSDDRAAASSPKKKRVRFPQQQDLLEWVTAQSTLKVATVAVLAGEVARFGDLISGRRDQRLTLPAFRIVEVVRVLTMQARNAVHLHGGVVEGFNGDRVVASFNGSHAVDRPGRRAILAGLDLVEGRAAAAVATQLMTASIAAVRFFPSPSASPQPPPNTPHVERLSPLHRRESPPSSSSQHDAALDLQLSWRVGAACGRAVVGIAGSWDVETHHIIGAVRAHAETLARLNKVYRQRGVLVSDLMVNECDDAQMLVRVLGLARLQVDQERPSFVAAVRSGSSTDRHQKLWNASVVLSAEGRQQESAAVRTRLRNDLGDDAERWNLQHTLLHSDLCIFDKQTSWRHLSLRELRLIAMQTHVVVPTFDNAGAVLDASRA